LSFRPAKGWEKSVQSTDNRFLSSFGMTGKKERHESFARQIEL
jgi:hypothetical protein